jgi:hypothetical protein
MHYVKTQRGCRPLRSRNISRLPTAVEGQKFNSSDAPSFIHVKYVGGAVGWMYFTNQHAKSQQGITDATRTIETNIIDDGLH